MGENNKPLKSMIEMRDLIDCSRKEWTGRDYRKANPLQQ
jgi:hypothetical protein